MRELRGKRVWVSGATGALGAQMVETCLALGCHVVASARRRTRLLDLRASLANHERLKVAENDAADPQGVEALLDGLWREEPLDIAIQCAGAFHYGALAETDDATLQRLVSSNLLASAFTLRGCLRRMLPRGEGQVVLVGAEAVRAPQANLAAYGAVKAAVAHLVEAARLEAADSRMRPWAVLPGMLDTPDNRAAGLDPETTPMLPLSRVCEDIVGLLCSPHDAGYTPVVDLPLAK